MKLSRRNFLALTGASALVAPSMLRALGPEDTEHSQYAQCFCSHSGKRPNVIMVFCDDLGWGDLGEFWQKTRDETATKIQTPHIDAAIKQGVMMTSAYTTAPVCAPARASMVTGKHQGHCSLRSNKFDCPIDTTMTIGTVMKRAGYSTWHIGKWGIGGGYQAAGDSIGHRSMACAAGFDYSYGYPAHMHGHSFYHFESNIDSYDGSPIVENVSTAVYGTQNHWLKNLSSPAGGADFTVDSGDGSLSGRGPYYRRAISNAEIQYCYDTDLFTAKIKQLIDGHLTHDEGKPFFCYACYTTVHGSGSRYDSTITNSKQFHIPGNAYPATDNTDATWGGGVTWVKDANGYLPFKSTAATANTYVHENYTSYTNSQQRYATNVQRLDDALGDLINFLKLRGVYENTLFIFTSDNGPAGENLSSSGLDWVQDDGFDSNGPFKGMKRWSYEGGLREPTWAVWPGVIQPEDAGTTPRVTAFPFQFPAWMATLADVAGLPQPARCDGVSILPELTGSGRQLPMRVYAEYSDGGSGESFGFEQMVRDEEYVLLLNRGKTTGVELYNVVNDPDQSENLAGNAQYADRVRYMTDLLISCRMPLGKIVASTGAIQAYGQSPNEVNNAAMPATPYPGVNLPKWQGKLYFDGADAWPWVPNFRTMLPARTFVAATGEIESKLTSLPEAYGLSLRGWIEVDAEQEVNFVANGTDGCHVWLHEAHVIDRDTMSGEVTVTMKLAKGRHPIRIYLTKKVATTRCTVTINGSQIV